MSVKKYDCQNRYVINSSSLMYPTGSAHSGAQTHLYVEITWPLFYAHQATQKPLSSFYTIPVRNITFSSGFFNMDPAAFVQDSGVF